MAKKNFLGRGIDDDKDDYDVSHTYEHFFNGEYVYVCVQYAHRCTHHIIFFFFLKSDDFLERIVVYNAK